MITEKKFTVEDEELLCKLVQIELMLCEPEDGKYVRVAKWESIKYPGCFQTTANYISTLDEELIELGYTDQKVEELFEQYQTGSLQLYPTVKNTAI